ncbi:uncharacterized protein LOC124658093 [Lolium rigidum]|uniref:uncharacterized protein LOC124658093 n=1 Tax=Lolium rigidum TaxID=89674 RepID=UPI001F5CB9AB|nr:uncharacterized protein LOC124658093 [Lolium rigidum]
MDQQNVTPGSTEFRERIHQCMVKVKRGKTCAVGVVIASCATFCYVITDKAIFANPRSKPYTIVFPEGAKQKVKHSDVRFADQLAGFYLEKPHDAAIPNAVILSDQTVVRNQTYYMFYYTSLDKIFSGICGANVTSTGVDTFRHHGNSSCFGGPVINDERQLIGISTREDCFLALGAQAIRSELLAILREDDSFVEFSWTMDGIVQYIRNMHAPQKKSLPLQEPLV